MDKRILYSILFLTIIGVFWILKHSESQNKHFLIAQEATAAESVQPLGQSGTWSILFSDEFNGTSVDTSKWSFTSSAESTCDPNGCSNPGNQQLEYNQGKNCTVSGGLLTITAKRENAGGRPWTSCMLHSKPQFKTMFLETRAKFPAKKGFWPGFWTWNGPQDEVDVFEYYSDNKTKIYLTDRTGGNSGCIHDLTFDPTADFHTYSAYMDGNNVNWYIDGQRICGGSGSPKQAASILLDMFVYEKIPPDASTTSEIMQVDYIRAWQKISNANPTVNTQPMGVTPTLYCLSGQPCMPSATPTTPVSNTINPKASTTPGAQNGNGSITPTLANQPCQSSETSSIQHNNGKKKSKARSSGGFLELFFTFLFRLLELLLSKIGLGTPGEIGNPIIDEPCPSPTINPSITPLPSTTSGS